MSEKDFLPVESSRLSDFFPELKHFILANYSRTFTIKIVSKFPTLTDLASLTDVHRSNVTSYINSLETQGIIHRQKKQLIVNDLEALEALAEEG